MDLIEALTQSVENKVNPEEIIKQLEKVLNECEKGKDKSQHKKIHLVLKKFSDDIFNHNVADLLKVQMKFCDRNIYRLFLEVENYELFLQQANEYFDSKNKISLFIIIKILTICSPKEIILFLNEHLNDINLIEKKFFIIEVYNRILDKIEKKELFLDQIFPLILISFSSAIQKFIKNKEKLNSNPEFITNKDIIINFEKYVINLIRNMMHLCKNFKEMQDPSIKNKLLTISDIVDIDQTTGKLNTKHLNPNLLLKHYLISFVMDIMEGVLDALSTPFFDRNILNTFLQELILYLFELNDNKFDFITCFLTQVRYFTIMNAKPSTIKENIRSYDKFYPYNCLAIANILSTLIKDETFNIFTMKYQLKLIMPVVYENFKSDDSKIQLYFPLIKQLGQLLNNEKGINQFNLFNFENLNIFNVPLADFVKYLLELSGNFNCEEDNRKVMVEMSNVLIEMPHEIVT